MIRPIAYDLCAATILVGTAFVGCSNQRSEPAASAVGTDSRTATHQKSAVTKDSLEIKEALARLTPDDRALAEKQVICPVSSEPLGSMGTPIKVAVQGRNVFVCCEGCINELKNNFVKYQDKLPEQS
jgi:hypothetical protein